MTVRRIVGIDLGIATAHYAVVVDETGQVVHRQRLRSTAPELQRLLDMASRDANGVQLEVVFEPTGVAWWPVAVFFRRHGHLVFRVSSKKAAKLREALSEKAKTNGIDALTLAKLAVFDREGLTELFLPAPKLAVLDRQVRAAQRMTEQVALHKRRARELTRIMMPMLDSAIATEIGDADMTLLGQLANPHAMLAAGLDGVTALLRKGSCGRLRDPESRARAWLHVAHQAVDVYGQDGLAFAAIAEEVACEVRFWRLAEDELLRCRHAREDAYLEVDPDQLVRTVPGIAKVGGPVCLVSIGDVARFAKAKQFKAFSGLTPRTFQTGDSDHRGTRISKAGSPRLRTQLVASANTARRLDPQLAAIYHQQMTAHGAHHQKALCVVAGKLAERVWRVLQRGEPYVLRDVDGTEVTPAQARGIIADKYTVTDEVRRRRRSRNSAKKVPHIRPGAESAAPRSATRSEATFSAPASHADSPSAVKTGA